MQEFVTVSSSSYDPASLATKLNEKSADGWTVVAIVPTGGDVTAFLSRESSDESASMATGAVAAGTSASTPSMVTLGAADAVKEDRAVESESEPVKEPAGWAAEPEKATEAPAETTRDETPAGIGLAGGAAAGAAAGGGASSTAASQSAGTGVPAAAAAAAPAAAAPAAAATPSVPAGWYADPAGRYELRYWDGGTWTEHVSRAGQQFTDAPVA